MIWHEFNWMWFDLLKQHFISIIKRKARDQESNDLFPSLENMCHTHRSCKNKNHGPIKFVHALESPVVMLPGGEIMQFNPSGRKQRLEITREGKAGLLLTSALQSTQSTERSWSGHPSWSEIPIPLLSLARTLLSRKLVWYWAIDLNSARIFSYKSKWLGLVCFFKVSLLQEEC